MLEEEKETVVAYAKTETEKPPRLTPQEYLEREQKAETKSEYHGGIVVAMAGASPEHNTITSNVHGELYGQLRGKDCRPFVSDLRVRVPECDKYYYPDVVVTCSEPNYEEMAGIRSLLNPTLIIEVLSDSTERTDRGEKWMCYQTLESLQSYVLISQDKPLIEVYRRQENGWFYTAVTGLESRVALDAIGCELKLADIYARVPFRVTPPPQDTDHRTAQD
ncbi:MAG TPA: Uma2 family endonuclease [Chthonomonadaceae bacterium]|nr:Uma2 family endonuclease [Chthonomonadaceae bacterium]